MTNGSKPEPMKGIVEDKRNVVQIKVTTAKIKVGINYPWHIDLASKPARDYCGWDFGDPPPGYGINEANKREAWRKGVEDNIKKLRDMGVFALRWFILADGKNYGVGNEAPQPDPVKNGEWRFANFCILPDLATGFKEDFEWLLGILKRYNLKFVPSLIDFKWGLPLPGKCTQGVVEGRRSDIIVDKNKRTKFFQKVLQPLLEISARENYKDVIYAWELINEPEGATQGSGEGDAKDAIIKKNEMVDFIEEGIRLINLSEFKSTVGYRRSKTIKEWKGRNSYLGVTLHQFHHYPTRNQPLPPHKFSQQYPIFIGEFATNLSQDPWPDTELKNDQSVVERLELIEKKKYPCAFPWSMNSDSPLKRDMHSDWSQGEKGIKKYLSK